MWYEWLSYWTKLFCNLPSHIVSISTKVHYYLLILLQLSPLVWVWMLPWHHHSSPEGRKWRPGYAPSCIPKWNQAQQKWGHLGKRQRVLDRGDLSKFINVAQTNTWSRYFYSVQYKNWSKRILYVHTCIGHSMLPHYAINIQHRKHGNKKITQAGVLPPKERLNSKPPWT